VVGEDEAVHEEEEATAVVAVDEALEEDAVEATGTPAATGTVGVEAVVVDMEEEEEVVEDLVVRMMTLRADGIKKKELYCLLLGPCRPFAKNKKKEKFFIYVLHINYQNF